MAKKYIDDNGMYLALCDGECGPTFGWYSPKEREVTCPMCDILTGPAFIEDLNTEKPDWEEWIVGKIALKMGANEHGYFETEEDAKAGMKAANEALLLMRRCCDGDRKSTPRRVVQATEAGRKP